MSRQSAGSAAAGQDKLPGQLLQVKPSCWVSYCRSREAAGSAASCQEKLQGQPLQVKRSCGISCCMSSEAAGSAAAGRLDEAAGKDSYSFCLQF